MRCFGGDSPETNQESPLETADFLLFAEILAEPSFYPVAFDRASRFGGDNICRQIAAGDFRRFTIPIDSQIARTKPFAALEQSLNHLPAF